MQKVELYDDIIEAKYDMENHIGRGWKIHTCTISAYQIGYGHKEKVLVVYEKE